MCVVHDVYLVQDDIDGKELSKEIAGLEGLMKDLSTISQRQYDT